MSKKISNLPAPLTSFHRGRYTSVFDRLTFAVMRIILILLVCGLFTCGCGQKGDLYLAEGQVQEGEDEEATP